MALQKVEESTSRTGWSDLDPTKPVSSIDISCSSVSGVRLDSKCGNPELHPKQVFDFVGYQFDLKEGKFRPTP